MNSSLRTELASGITPRSRLAAASLKDTSDTFSENVENAFSLTCTSGCGSEGSCGASFGKGRSSEATVLVVNSHLNCNGVFPADVSNWAITLLAEPAAL